MAGREIDLARIIHNSAAVAGERARTHRVLRYNCELNPLHIDAATFPPFFSDIASSRFARHEAGWFNKEVADKNGVLAEWTNNIIKQTFVGMEQVWDVDDAGVTKNRGETSLFAPWVQVNDASGVYARFSQGRTAMHTFGALRTPVMNGVALEVTSDPESLDPRDAVTAAIYEFAMVKGVRAAWYDEKGKIFDLTSYKEKPFFAGPLYYPNENTDERQLNSVRGVTVELLRRTIQGY